MGKKLLRIMILTIFSLIIVSSLAFAVPMTINYQGKLTDPNGRVLNGEYQMCFSLFANETNGTALWNEQQTVTIINGIYNIRLGAVTPLSAIIFSSDSLYLEISIGSETLQPRNLLTSVAFAIKANDAETVGGVTISDAINSHSATPDAHHTKTTSFTELADTATDAQIPDDITVNHALNADKVDGMDSSELLEKVKLMCVTGELYYIFDLDPDPNNYCADVYSLEITNPKNNINPYDVFKVYCNYDSVDNILLWGLRCKDGWINTGCSGTTFEGLADLDISQFLNGCHSDDEEYGNANIFTTCCKLIVITE